MSMDEDTKKEQRKLIIESNPRRNNDDIYSRFIDEKKHTVLVVASSHQPSHMAKMYELSKRMKENFENSEKAFLSMSEAGLRCAEAEEALSKALRKLAKVPLVCPEDMIMDYNMDFSNLERIVLDSLTPIGPRPSSYGGRFYDECGEISKKTYKKLLKALDKKEKRKEGGSYKQDQTDRFCNKWNKKIKRKL